MASIYVYTRGGGKPGRITGASLEVLKGSLSTSGMLKWDHEKEYGRRELGGPVVEGEVV